MMSCKSAMPAILTRRARYCPDRRCSPGPPLPPTGEARLIRSCRTPSTRAPSPMELRSPQAGWVPAGCRRGRAPRLAEAADDHDLGSMGRGIRSPGRGWASPPMCSSWPSGARSVTRDHLREPPVGRTHAARGADADAGARLRRLAVLDLPVAARPGVRRGARSIGARKTVVVGAGISALSCRLIFVPGVRVPERANYSKLVRARRMLPLSDRMSVLHALTTRRWVRSRR
jgi:hypothetical protein